MRSDATLTIEAQGEYVYLEGAGASLIETIRIPRSNVVWEVVEGEDPDRPRQPTRAMHRRKDPGQGR